MTRYVHRQGFCNPAYAGNLSKIGVHTLVGYDRKENPSTFTKLMVFVFFCYIAGSLQIGDTAYIFGFLACFVNPEVTVIILRYVFRLQTFHIREGQTSEGAEDEDVAYNIQTFKCECLFHDCCQLLLGEELTVRCFGLKTQSLKWIYLHPLVVKSQHDDSFENLAVFVGRILFLFLVSAKIQVEVSDKGIVNSREREVVCFILFFL